MANLIFTSAQGAITFTTAPDEFYRTAGKYFFNVGMPRIRETKYFEIETPGVDFVATRNEGKRKRQVGPFTVGWVAAQNTGLLGIIRADLALLEGNDALIAITWPDNAVSKACKIISCNVHKDAVGREFQLALQSGLYFAMYDIGFESMED